jgi:hypothetical protein
MSQRADRYTLLLAFYTPHWRKQNGRAVLDLLRDEHAQSGRSGPSARDALSFAQAGIQERLLTPHVSPGTLATTALVLLAAIGTALYSGAVLWAAGANWPGHFGPFSNPAPIAGAFFIGSAGFALASRDGMARLLASAGGASALLLIGLAVPGGWLGPGFQVSFAMVGLGLLATRSVRGPVAVAVAVVLVCVPPALPFSRGLVDYLVRSTDWFGGVWIGYTVAGAALLLVLGWRSPSRSAESAFSSQPQVE